jgi:pimeloyl-ACP methyl ester carboxylesterase
MSKTKNNQEIPTSIIKTAQFLEKLSPKLASDFAIKLFTTPIKHKLPKREEPMEQNSKQTFVHIPNIDKKIRVFEYGSGSKKALLVHGWSGRGTQLVSIADALIKQGYTVISFDAPAHGKSEGKVSYMTMFIESILELERIYGGFEVAIGHSLGGMSVMNSLKRGLILQKAVIVGSGDIVHDIFEEFIFRLGLKPTIIERMKKKFEKRFNDKLTNYDVFEAAKNIEIPVFVIHDTQDQDVPVKCAYHIHKHLKNGKLLITEGLGHRKILGDKAVVQEIISFVV